MPDQRYSSRFTYTNDELDLNKVIAFMQAEMEEMRTNDEQFNQASRDAIARAEAFALQRGITPQQLDVFKLQSKDGSENRNIPDKMRTWNEIVR